MSAATTQLASAADVSRYLPAVQAREYDDLPPDVLAGFDGAHIPSLEREALRSALAASVGALVREAAEAEVADVAAVADRLGELR